LLILLHIHSTTPCRPRWQRSPGECGYNQFLYPNWRDVKQIFTFLVARVPRDGELGGDDDGGGGIGIGDGGGGALLNHNIQVCLKAWRGQTWVPPFCAAGSGSRGAGHWLRTDPVAFCSTQAGARHVLCPAVNRQVQRPGTDLGPSLLEENALAVARAHEAESLENTDESRRAKARARLDAFRRAFAGEDPAALSRAAGRAGAAHGGDLSMNDLLDEMAGGDGDDGDATAFKKQTEFSQEAAAPTQEAAAIAAEAEADKEEEAKQERLRREAEMDELQNQLRAILGSIAEVNKGTELSGAKAKQAEAQVAGLMVKKKALEAEYKIKAATLKMLPNAEANIKKLQEICAGSNERLLELASQWEEHRRPLVSYECWIIPGTTRRLSPPRPPFPFSSPIPIPPR
jgi:hypothetical protein